MNQKINAKFLIYALICSIALQACVSMMSRQQQVEYMENKMQLVVGPAFMPAPISKRIKRLSVIYVTPSEDYPATTSIIDIAINFLKSRQADLSVIDRETTAAVQKEFAYQLTGSVSPATMAQIGKHLGADALLLIYIKPIAIDDFSALQNYGGSISSSVDLRLIYVEDGSVLFSTNVMAYASFPVPPDGKYWLPKTIKQFHDAVTGYATAYELSSLAAAFGENSLGIVPDMDAGVLSQLKKETRPGVTVFGLLEGSPAHKSGFQRFDRIVRVDGRPIASWVDKVRIPAIVTIDRNGDELDIRVQ